MDDRRNKKLLSICIPTFNRDIFLAKSLESLVSQDRFAECEVIISDNASTDNTEVIGKEYSDKYSNVEYYRNEKNEASRNYLLALGRANGIVRKLSNDTLIYRKGAISSLLDVVSQRISSRELLCFMNVTDKTIYDCKLESMSVHDEYIIDNFDTYIRSMGISLTSIANIIIWEDDCELLHILNENRPSLISSVPFFMELFCKHKKAIIVDCNLIEKVQVGQKRPKIINYDMFQTFYTTFLYYIRLKVETGDVTKETYEFVRKGILFDFFIHWVNDLRVNGNRFITRNNDLRYWIYINYKDEDYYSEYKKRLRMDYINKLITKLKTPLRFIRNKIRQKNT